MDDFDDVNELNSTISSSIGRIQLVGRPGYNRSYVIFYSLLVVIINGIVNEIPRGLVECEISLRATKTTLLIAILQLL